MPTESRKIMVPGEGLMVTRIPQKGNGEYMEFRHIHDLNKMGYS